MKRTGLLRCVESKYGVESWQRRDLPTTSGNNEVRSWLHWQPFVRMLNTIGRRATCGRRKRWLSACSCLRCGINSSFLVVFQFCQILCYNSGIALCTCHIETLDIEGQQQNPSCTIAHQRYSNLETIPVPIIRRPTPNPAKARSKQLHCSSPCFQAFPPEFPFATSHHQNTPPPHSFATTTSSMPRTVHSPLR